MAAGRPPPSSVRAERLLRAAGSLLLGFSAQTKTVLFIQKKAVPKDVQALWMLIVAAAAYHAAQLVRCLCMDRLASSGAGGAGCRRLGRAVACASFLLDKMEDDYRETYWFERGRPIECYPDESKKDAPVPPDIPIPKCDYGMQACVKQSHHPDTAARCYYTCGSSNPYMRCFFFQGIDGLDKFDLRYLLFNDWWRRFGSTWDHFKPLVPPLPNPLEMKNEEKTFAAARRIELSVRCYCGDEAMINPDNKKEFICPNIIRGIVQTKCDFNEWLNGPKSHWPEPEQHKKKSEVKVYTLLACAVQV